MTKALRAQGIQVAVLAKSNHELECDLYIQADLSEFYQTHNIIRRVVDTLGGLDILVNNAGAQAYGKFTEYNLTQFNRDYNLMVLAPFLLSQQAAKHMLAHGGGHIVNVLSTVAFQGARNISGYVTAKHALLGLTRAMAVELAPTIRVNAISPGLVETDMTAGITPERKVLLNSITPAGRFVTPDEVAGALLYLINSTVVYGHTVIVDNGWLSKNGS